VEASPLCSQIAFGKESVAMAKSYYSTVFIQSADTVWCIVRDFNAYPVWVDGAGASEIENGKSGNTVGAVRRVLYNGRTIRQRLLAQSDVERAQTYAFAEDGTLPVDNYRATVRVTPIVDGDRAFVEWWATFDCESSEREERTAFFSTAFAGWLESLRRTLVKAGV
jgi:Polyketide cyclase / dehydrase and lipid transport